MPAAAWRSQPLEKVADIGSGATKGRRIDPDDSVEVPYLRVANVQAGEIDLTEVKHLTVRTADVERYALAAGDVLLTEGGDPDKLGRGAIWDGSISPCIHQNHVFRVRLDQQVISPRFFSRFLGSAPARKYFLRAAKQTTGIASINKTQLRALPVPVPPLDEQRRIATILDKADAIRRKRREAIALTEELLRSTFLEMFGDPVTNPKGWRETTLASVAEINSGITKNRRLAPEDAVELPYMRVANVQDGYLDLDEIKTIPVPRDRVDRYLLQVGDVLLTEGGDPDKLGRGTVWKGQIPRCVHQNHIFSVRVDQEKLVPEYASALIGSDRGKRYFLKAGKQTTGIASINKTQLKAFPILLPPLAMQRQFDTAVARIRSLAEQLAAGADTADDLFHSLVQRAFRGEL